GGTRGTGDDGRTVPTAGALRVLGALSFFLSRRRGVPAVPVGLVASGGRSAGRGVGWTTREPRRSVVGPVVGVPTDVPLRSGEAHQRRSDVASSHGLRLPLLDAAAAHLDQ